MGYYSIIIHGGATTETEFIREHMKEIEIGLDEAIMPAYELLKKGKSAIDAVELALSNLEDNPYFNCGRGSCINANGHIEMDAVIMDGNELRSGAVAMIQKAKNPIKVARRIMETTQHIILGGEGAIDFANEQKMEMEHEAYFATVHRYNEYMDRRKKLSEKEKEQLRTHGTTGAVALDTKGNLAAGATTGGTPFNKSGRIGDAASVGSGVYANNLSCGIAGSGNGEYLMRTQVASYISFLVKHMGYSAQQACDYVVHEVNKGIKGDIGVIGLDPQGNIAVSFNCDIMQRAWMAKDDHLKIKIYK